MNLTPLYELRDRLSASAVAGIQLIAEDFRLARAVEQVQPLGKAAPVFQKICAMAQKLIAEDCEDRGAVLLEVLALLDAVLCTQAVTSVSGEITPLDLPKETICSNAPYSRLAPLLEALTETGGGRYRVIEETLEQTPELFQDYRLRSVLVRALGDSYQEIGDLVAKQFIREGKAAIPTMKRGLNPAGGKDMARRIRIIEAIAGAEENDYYLSLLKTAQKQVREAVILALRHKQDPEQAQIVLDLIKTEKGNCKKNAQFVLTYLDTPDTEAYWQGKIQKNPGSVVSFLSSAQSDRISDLIAQELTEQIRALLEEESPVLTEKTWEKLNHLLSMLSFKGSGKMQELYRFAAAHRGRLNSLRPEKREDKQTNRFGKEQLLLGDVFPYLLRENILVKNDPRLLALAQELHREYGEYWAAPALEAALLSQPASQVYDQFAGYFTEAARSSPKNRLFTPLDQLYTAFQNALYQKEEQCHFFRFYFYDPFLQSGEYYWMKFQEPLDSRWYSLFTELDQGGKGRHESLLRALLNPKDEKCCAVLGEYFYRLAKTVKDNTRLYSVLAQCGWKDYKGLLPLYVRQKRGVSTWYVRNVLRDMPLTGEEKAAEIQELWKIIKRENLTKYDWSEERVSQWCLELQMQQIKNDKE